MALTQKHAKDVCCCYGAAKCCKYLSHEYTTGAIKYLCLKLVSTEKTRIDKETQEFLKQARKMGQDPRHMGRPLGDHCKGMLYLKHKQQGKS